MTANPSGHGTLSLVLHAGGLVVVYSFYSVLQEKIMKTSYGPDEQHFTSSSLLVFSNRLFSLAIGILFSLFLPSREAANLNTGLPTPLSSRERLSPKWPMYFYLIVAAANFASTYCQYDALRYVGFTTQALAKCAKMVPVLLIGRLFYKKSYKEKEYVAGVVVLFGCFIYLASGPTTSKPSKHAPTSTSSSPWAPFIGCLLLCLYLGFDGLTSTTQEHYFGKSKKDANGNSISPLTPGGPVLDQMVFVNACATAISLLICLVNWSKTSDSLTLTLSEPSLWFDVTMLSATATFGLIILYDTIHKHGALTVATVMTCRQFWSIIMNAGIFGNFASVGFAGWTGVGFVASGVWIKTSRAYDPPKAPANYMAISGAADDDRSKISPVAQSIPMEMNASSSGMTGRGSASSTPYQNHTSQFEGPTAALLPQNLQEQEEEEKVLGMASSSTAYGDGSKRSIRMLAAQYGIPLMCPVVFAAIASIFI